MDTARRIAALASQLAKAAAELAAAADRATLGGAGRRLSLDASSDGYGRVSVPIFGLACVGLAAGMAMRHGKWAAKGNNKLIGVHPTIVAPTENAYAV